MKPLSILIKSWMTSRCVYSRKIRNYLTKKHGLSSRGRLSRNWTRLEANSDRLTTSRCGHWKRQTASWSRASKLLRRIRPNSTRNWRWKENRTPCSVKKWCRNVSRFNLLPRGRSLLSMHWPGTQPSLLKVQQWMNLTSMNQRHQSKNPSLVETPTILPKKSKRLTQSNTQSRHLSQSRTHMQVLLRNATRHRWCEPRLWRQQLLKVRWESARKWLKKKQSRMWLSLSMPKFRGIRRDLVSCNPKTTQLSQYRF